MINVHYSKSKELVYFSVEIVLLLFILIRDIIQMFRCRITSNNRINDAAKNLIVLGTGPSLANSLTKVIHDRDKFHFMAVNNFPIVDSFFEVKPEYLCFIDSMYWVNSHSLDLKISKNIDAVYNELNKVNWKMNLFIPVQAKGIVSKRIKNKNIIITSIKYPSYDFASLTVALLSLSLGMMSPRINVVVTGIHLSVRLGYKNIRTIGVDMDRIKGLQVDQITNETYLGVKYFYDTSKPKITNKLINKKGHPVYIRLMRETSTFKWFMLINEYSKIKRVHLCNASEYSFIDSIDRCKL